MKKLGIHTSLVQISILAVSSLSFAINDGENELTQPVELQAQRGNAGAFSILNGDAVNLIGMRLKELKDFGNFRQTCHYIEHSTRAQMQARKAQAEIAALIGEVVEVEAGSYMKGSPAGEPNPFGNNEAPHLVQIEKPFLMQKYQVSQGQYTKLMGNGPVEAIRQWATQRGLNPSHFIGAKKPMVRLTRAEEDAYIEKLNQRLKKLWSLAYPPGSRALVQLKKPSDDRREYVTTGKLSEPQTIEVNGKHVEITAEHRLYPVELPADRTWQEGPRDVDSPELGVNERGIQGLTQNTWDVTLTNYHGSSYFVLCGGSWHDDPGRCRSASRLSVSSWYRYEHVGLRLVSDLP